MSTFQKDTELEYDLQHEENQNMSAEDTQDDPDATESGGNNSATDDVRDPGSSSSALISKVARRGDTKWSDGQLMWRNPTTNCWMPAVHHSQIRDRLIAEASLQGEYTHRRRAGKLPNDVTSFLQAQRSWGPARADWPPIVHRFRAEEHDRSTTVANPWITAEGWLVLDLKNSPVLDFPELPATISSKVEPVFLEAWCRLNMNIKRGHIRARMPDDPNSMDGKWDGLGDDPIRLTTLGAAVTRFRDNSGCITWEPRVGTDAKVEYMVKLLPLECQIANSTLGFRDLYKHEVAEMRLTNAGGFPKKARGPIKDLSKARRAFVKKEAHQVYEKAKAEFEMTEMHEDVEDEDKEGLPDCRSSIPRSKEHFRLIELLLLPAKEMYNDLTGDVAPETDKSLSYRHQLRALQRALQDWYSAEGVLGPAPKLVRLHQLNIDGVRWSSAKPPTSLYGSPAWAEFGPLLNWVLKDLDQEFVWSHRRAATGLLSSLP